MDRINILGLPIWNPSYEAFRMWFERATYPSHSIPLPTCRAHCIPESGEGEGRKPVILGIVNAHTANLAHESETYRRALESSDVLINDGAGMAMAAKMRGHELKYNFNGTDLFPRLFSELSAPLKVFLYGSSMRSNIQAKEAIERRFPMVEVVGHCIGFQRRKVARIPGTPAEPDVVDLINRSGADLLLVALGQPKQEIWIAENAACLHVGVVCGVGALFDFLSGNVPRAPRIVRRAKMEWAYRLMREPRRMFRRYVMGNPKFLIRARRLLRTDAGRAA
ncbi:MAG: WecB/TagA/CpsF family glycosyltransferase [Fimbriimonadaceae bacterium]